MLFRILINSTLFAADKNFAPDKGDGRLYVISAHKNLPVTIVEHFKQLKNDHPIIQRSRWNSSYLSNITFDK
jgi:hypothetical protein